jgi:hypothetical protein
MVHDFFLLNKKNKNEFSVVFQKHSRTKGRKIRKKIKTEHNLYLTFKIIVQEWKIKQ